MENFTVENMLLLMTFFDPVNSLNGWHCHPHLVREIEPQGGERRALYLVTQLASGRTGTGRQMFSHHPWHLVSPCGPRGPLAGSEVQAELGSHSCRSGAQDWSI